MDRERALYLRLLLEILIRDVDVECVVDGLNVMNECRGERELIKKMTRERYTKNCPVALIYARKTAFILICRRLATVLTRLLETLSG